MTAGPLVNIGDLSKPATALVKKISGAIGILYEPRGIRKVADAQAYAARVAAQARVEITDIERRALERLVREEGKKQANIEGISQIAIEHLKPDANPEDVADDWIVHLFEKSRIVSDKDMQTLWARILAGEANLPGTFSRRTIEFLSTLDKLDAESFTSICRLCWKIGGILTPIIYDYSMDIYSVEGIDFSLLEHLNDIGLISFSNTRTTSYQLTQLSPECVFSYFGESVIVSNIGNGNFGVGMCVFTQTGRELASVCFARRSDAFFEFFLNRLSEQGHTPYSRLGPAS